MKARFWLIVHNAIAHPLLCFETSWADKFHDWTFDKYLEANQTEI